MRAIYLGGKYGRIYARRKALRVKIYDGEKYRESIIPPKNVEVLVTAGKINVSEEARRLLSNAVHISLTTYGTRLAYVAYNPRTMRKRNSAFTQAEAVLSGRYLGIAIKLERDLFSNMEKHAAKLGYSLDFSRLKEALEDASSIEEIEGIESIAWVEYYDMLRQALPVGWKFGTRTRYDRRPPSDETNAMISLVNTALYSITYAYLTYYGLVPEIGFIHKSSNAPLAYDISEPLKPIIGYQFLFEHVFNDEREFEEKTIGKRKGKFLKREYLLKFFKKRSTWLSGKNMRRNDEEIKKKTTLVEYIKRYIKRRLGEIMG